MTNQNQLPDPPSFERKAVPDKSDNDIRNLASANLTEFEQANRRAIESMIEEAGTLLKSNRESEKQRAEQLMSQIDEAFENARRNSDNDALRRGLARSSIAVNRTADIETAAAARRADASAENLANLTEIDNRLAGLTAKREQALNEFNIAYAARLTQEINSLTQDRDRRADEAMRYNNQMLAKERQFEADRGLNQSRLDTEALRREELSDSINATRDAAERARLQEELFAQTFNSLNSMSARDARNEIRNNVLLREQLTPSQFFRLYDRFGR